MAFSFSQGPAQHSLPQALRGCERKQGIASLIHFLYISLEYYPKLKMKLTLVKLKDVLSFFKKNIYLFGCVGS